MIFNNEKALNQFLSKGIVATLREYPYKSNQNIIINHKYKAKVKNAILKPTFATIEHSVRISGFSSCQEWLDVARRLHKKLPRYLVIVERRLNEDKGVSEMSSGMQGHERPYLPSGLGRQK